MISIEDFDNYKFSRPESDSIELKISIDYKSFDKYIETICAFLNSSTLNNVSYLIFGVSDTLENVGLKIDQKSLDKFILQLDSIIHLNKIIGIENNTNKFVKINTKTITIKQITSKSSKLFLIVEVKKTCDNILYQLSNGNIYYRLGASNFWEKTEKIYKESDFENMCKTIKKNADNENKENLVKFKESIKLYENTIKLYKNTIKDKEKELSDTTQLVNIYKTHFELNSSLIKNNNSLVNNNSLISNIIEYIFPCYK